MPRFRHAVMALLAALLLSGCGTPSDLTPDTAAVVEEQSPPEPTCAPANTTSDTPPEPDLSRDHNGDDINDSPAPADDC